MDLTVYWTEFAENKLDDIFDYYKTKACISAVVKLLTGIVDKTVGLNKNLIEIANILDFRQNLIKKNETK